MTNHPMEEKWKEEFDKEFLYWVVLGSTLNDGSELRWNVGDGKLPDIEKIKSFIENLLEQERKKLVKQIDSFPLSDSMFFDENNWKAGYKALEEFKKAIINK